MYRWITTGLVLLIVGSGALADTVELAPAQDNTLYESATGALSNGSGTGLFAGRTGQPAIRRALVAFDLTAIPPGSTIQSVSLRLNVAGSNTGSLPFPLHRVLTAWGESTSVAPGNGGSGTPAAAGDVTWLHTFFDTEFWSQAGGDFALLPSGSTDVAGVGAYVWGSNVDMVDDVQGWVDDDSTNHGWILLEPATPGNSSKRFDSREAADATRRPRLTVEFIPGPICGNGELEGPEECDDGNTEAGDGCAADCTEEPPLLVSLSSFTAERTRRGIEIRWTTALEIDHAGFRLLREVDLRDREGPVVITPQIIAPEGTEWSGGEYEHLDRQAVRHRGVTLRYYLEDIDVWGRVTRHGPVVVQPVGVGAGRPVRVPQGRSGSTR